MSQTTNTTNITTGTLDVALGKLLVVTRRARTAHDGGCSEADAFAWEYALATAAVNLKQAYRALVPSERDTVENTVREALSRAKAVANDLSARRTQINGCGCSHNNGATR